LGRAACWIRSGWFEAGPRATLSTREFALRSIPMTHCWFAWWGSAVGANLKHPLGEI